MPPSGGHDYVICGAIWILDDRYNFVYMSMAYANLCAVKYCCGRQMAAREFERIIASCSDLARFWHNMAAENMVFVYTVPYSRCV